jgi:hypothetical protein
MALGGFGITSAADFTAIRSMPVACPALREDALRPGQLALAYSMARRRAGSFYAEVAEDAPRALREMSTPDGAFYSAEDADSVPPDASEHPPGPADSQA